MSLFAGLCLWFAAIAPFTERGQVDFDGVIDLLNPWGTWAETTPNDWHYHPITPADAIPFTHGRWVYTDFGWSWAGKSPVSWATDHYGWWVLEVNPTGSGPGVWGWHPSPDWHAAPVDFRQTKEYIGWRPSQLGPINELLEKEDDRFAHPEEWIWVLKAKFGAPLEAADVVTGAGSKAILEDSEPVTHIFTAWRDIERPGPNPAVLTVDGIIPPQDRKEGDPVKPFEILCLPTFWTPLPTTVNSNALYLYRPDVYQDQDGVERRVKKWYHPLDEKAQAEERKTLDTTLKELPLTK